MLFGMQLQMPKNGVILQGEDVKTAIIYDKNLQKFKTYHQELI